MIRGFMIGVIAAAARFVSSGSIDPPAFGNVRVLLHCDSATNGSTTFVDSSSYARTVTAFGGSKQVLSSSFYGTSYAQIYTSGDSTQSRLEVSYSSSVHDVGSQDFSWEFTMQMDTVTTAIVAQNATGTGAYAYQIYISTNKLGFRGSDTSGGIVYTMVGTTTILANTKYFVQCVRSGGVFSIYLNGVLEATQTISSGTTLSVGGSILIVGNYNTGAAFPFPGKLDEIRFSIGWAAPANNRTTVFPDS